MFVETETTLNKKSLEMETHLKPKNGKPLETESYLKQNV